MTLYSGKGMTGVKRILALLMLLVMCSVCALSEAEPALTVNGSEISCCEADAWMDLVRSTYAEICDYYQRCLGVSYWSLTYPNGLSVWMSVKSDAFKQLVMISLFNAINTADLTITFADKNEGTLSVEFHARQASVDDYDEAPFEVIFFDKAS